MRILAVGATGFIGRAAVGRLVERGHDVGVLHRGRTATGLPPGVRVIRGDRNRLDRSRMDIERFAPDVVLDVIPFTERQAHGLVEALRGRAGRVVALSSADVYRNYDGLRRRATAPPIPRRSPRTRRCARRAIRTADRARSSTPTTMRRSSSSRR